VITINKLKLIKILLIIGAAAAVLVLAALLIVNGIVKHSAKPYIFTDTDTLPTDFDCILVLGCGVRNGSPSPMLEDRLKTALSLYDLSASPKILVSGDNGSRDYDEVSVMRDYLLAQDVPVEAIFMDHAGFSTYESAYRARDIFCADKVLIVTQSYHLYRAVYDARALGLDAYGYSADLRSYYGQAVREVREVLARAKDFVYSILKPLPTYRGEQSPISGAGNAEN